MTAPRPQTYQLLLVRLALLDGCVHVRVWNIGSLSGLANEGALPDLTNQYGRAEGVVEYLR